jgi:hypothetical protein
MSKNSDRIATTEPERRGARFWLRVAVGVLAVLNGVALFFYLAPPGGSQKELLQQSQAVQSDIMTARTRTARLSNVAAKVTVGNTESSDFEARYFLPKRLAYSVVISEIQRMSKAAAFQERDAFYTEEPIEGTNNLDLLSCTASFDGSYTDLMRFLYEVDHSPMLLILENVQATPQQHAGQITASIRFQAVIEDDSVTGVQTQ